MSTVRPLRIATRQSAQATAQARAVGDAIAVAYPGLTVELVAVETLGDQRADVPLHTMGGQGVFVKEVQRAVLDGYADLAVHSAKDLPTERPAGLDLAAFCARRDPADALVGRALDDLAHGVLGLGVAHLVEDLALEALHHVGVARPEGLALGQGEGLSRALGQADQARFEGRGQLAGAQGERGGLVVERGDQIGRAHV